jgi:hypothetical protein
MFSRATWVLSYYSGTYLRELGKTWKYGVWIPHDLSPHQLQHRVDACIKGEKADPGIHQDPLGSSGIQRDPWDPLESSGIRGIRGIHWNPVGSVGSIGIHWDPAGSSGIQWDPVGSIGIHWDQYESIEVH